MKTFSASRVIRSAVAGCGMVMFGLAIRQMWVNCSAKKNSDGDYELTCGNEKIGVVENGRIGKDGDDCSIASDKDGIVLLVCGKGKDADTTKFFKAVCGDESFDPSEEYCYESKLYSCNGKPYNPSTQYCEDKKIKDRSSAK